MSNKIKISGTGCALADFVYNNVDFNSPGFLKYRSSKTGDGGLSPGKLVFAEELEKFAGRSYPQILAELTDGKEPETFNIGGPSIVSLIHVAQMLNNDLYEVDFYGISGKDETSQKIRELLKNTPLNMQNYLPESEKPTPFTHVLSDPDFDYGHGERTFINNIGAAWDLTPEFLPESFFESEIVCFGGTALTPNLHDNLHQLLQKAKDKKAITVVNTVYDFRNEKKSSSNRWPVGDSGLSYPNIDLLIMDLEEAKRISGYENVKDIIQYFRKHVAAFAITRGANSVIFHASESEFDPISDELPVSKEVTAKIRNKEFNGDTTGCGDNFVGGMIVSMAEQLQNQKEKLNLKEAVISGICSGGFACSYHGGTYFEDSPGEKKQQIEKLISAYQNQ